MDKYIKVSQLTAYEKKRLNRNRKCLLCGEEIKDFELLLMVKKRDRHKMYYEFTHKKCDINLQVKEKI